MAVGKATLNVESGRTGLIVERRRCGGGGQGCGLESRPASATREENPEENRDNRAAMMEPVQEDGGRRVWMGADEDTRWMVFNCSKMMVIESRWWRVCDWDQVGQGEFGGCLCLCACVQLSIQ